MKWENRCLFALVVSITMFSEIQGKYFNTNIYILLKILGNSRDY